MFEVYILESKINTNRHYIGHTDNLTVRLKQHNAGKVRSTKAYKPWNIIYIEKFNSKKTAYKREMQIKSYKGGETFKKLIK